MQKIKKIGLSVALASALGLGFVGCGSGSGGASSAPTAYFVDSAVSGISYSSPSYSGVTDAQGAFHYTKGEATTFKVGNVTLGSISSIPTDGKVMPQDVVGISRTQKNTAVTNMAQFLQSIDSDGNPSNGISIATATSTALATAYNIQSVSSSQLGSIVSSAGKNLVSSSTALSHLASTASSVTGNTITTLSTYTPPSSSPSNSSSSSSSPSNSSSSSSSSVAATAVSGVAIDGKLSGSTVCLDTKLTGTCNDETIKTTTNANGTYSLNIPNSVDGSKYPLIVEGGFDMGANGTKFKGKIKGYTSLKSGDDVVLSPLTTLVAEKIKAGATPGDASQEIADSLGLSSAEKAFSNPKDDAEVYKQAQKVQKTMEVFRSAAKKIAGSKTDSQLLEEAFKAFADVLTTGAAFDDQLDDMSDKFVENLKSDGLDIDDTAKTNMKDMSVDVILPFAQNIAEQTFDITDTEALKKSEAAMSAFSDKMEMDFEAQTDMDALVAQKDTFANEMDTDMQQFVTAYENAGDNFDTLKPDQMAAMVVAFGDTMDESTMNGMMKDPALLAKVGDLDGGFDGTALAEVKQSIESEIETNADDYVDFINIDEFKSLTDENFVPISLTDSGFIGNNVKNIEFLPDGHTEFTYDGNTANVTLDVFMFDNDYVNSQTFGQLIKKKSSSSAITLSTDGTMMNINSTDTNVSLVSYTEFGVDGNSTTENLFGTPITMPTNAKAYAAKILYLSNTIGANYVVTADKSQETFNSLENMRTAFVKDGGKYLFNNYFDGNATNGKLIDIDDGVTYFTYEEKSNFSANYSDSAGARDVLVLTSTLDGSKSILYVNDSKVEFGILNEAGSFTIERFYDAAALGAIQKTFKIPPMGLAIKSITSSDGTLGGAYGDETISFQLKSDAGDITDVNSSNVDVYVSFMTEDRDYSEENNYSNAWDDMNIQDLNVTGSTISFDMNDSIAGKYKLDIAYDKYGVGRFAIAGIKIFDLDRPQFTQADVNSSILANTMNGDGYLFLGDGRVVMLNDDMAIQNNQAPIFRDDGNESYNTYALWSVADGNITFDLNNTNVDKYIPLLGKSNDFYFDSNFGNVAVGYGGRADYYHEGDKLFSLLSSAMHLSLKPFITDTIVPDTNISVLYTLVNDNDINETYTLGANGDANLTYATLSDGIIGVTSLKYRVIDQNASIIFYDLNTSDVNSSLCAGRDSVVIEIVNESQSGEVSGHVFHYYNVNDVNSSNYKDLNDTDDWFTRSISVDLAQ